MYGKMMKSLKLTIYKCKIKFETSHNDASMNLSAVQGGDVIKYIQLGISFWKPDVKSQFSIQL